MIDGLPAPMRRVAKAVPDAENQRWVCTLACGHVVYVRMHDVVSPVRGGTQKPPRQSTCDDCVALTGVDVVAEAMRCHREVRAAAELTTRAESQIRQAAKASTLAGRRLRYNVERMSAGDRERYRVQCARRRLKETPWE